MTSKLFIDDLRYPPDDTRIVVRNIQEATDYLDKNNIPDVISFDHDLGGGETSITIINYITEGILDGKFLFPVGFAYHIHSANPVGSENIKSKMDQLLKHFEGY